MEEDEQRKSKEQDRKNPGNLKALEWMNTKIMTTFHFNSTGLLNNS
jgi:hypothetical protein